MSEQWVVQRYVVDRDGIEVGSTARGNLTERLRVVDATEPTFVIAEMVAGSANDANLIASAPDLLAACRDARAAIVSNDSRRELALQQALERIHAAVDKAGGK